MKYDKFFRLPEGAISLRSIDEIHMNRLLEEGGADDLIPVMGAYSRGLLLEEEGKIAEAQKLYRKVLRENPDNPWIKEAADRIKYSLN